MVVELVVVVMAVAVAVAARGRGRGNSRGSCSEVAELWLLWLKRGCCG